MDALTVQGWLRALLDGSSGPADVFPQLARSVPQFFVPCANAASDGTPSLLQLRQHNQRFGIVLTDSERSTKFAGGGQSARAIPALAVITAAIRQGVDGLVVNPETDRLLLDPRMLRLLFREYALEAMRQSSGAWVLTQAGQIWMIELQRGVVTVPVYVSEADAQEIGTPNGTIPKAVAWAEIRRQCSVFGAEAYLQMGYPEQIGIPRRFVGGLCGDGVEDPLDNLERIISGTTTTATADAVCDALARLKYVWSVQDEDGGIVAGGIGCDLFTSATNTQDFIDAVQQKNVQMGPMYPRYLPAKPLFQALSQRQAAVSINRGSSSPWSGSTSTIARVLSRSQQA